MRALRAVLKEAPLLTGLTVLASSLAGAGVSALLAATDRLATDGAPRATFYTFGALCLVVVTLRVAARLLRSHVVNHRFLVPVRKELGARIARAELRDTEVLGDARLLGMCTEHVMLAAWGFIGAAMAMRSVATMVAALAYAAWLAPHAFWLLLAGLAAAGAVFWFQTRWSARVTMDAVRALAEVHEDVGDLIGGLKNLKLAREARRDFFERGFVPHAEALRRHSFRAGMLGAFGGVSTSALFFGVVALLLFGGPRLASMPAGVIGSYVVVLLYLEGEFVEFVDNLPLVLRGEGALAELEGVTLRPEPDDAPELDAFESIQLRGVVVEYQGEAGVEFCMGPVDFDLHPGEIVFVVGGNGSGKSTLAKVLLGLYGASAGQVLVDGRPIPEERRDGYRQLFSAVLAKPYVFEKLWGIDGPGVDERAARYLEKLELTGVVSVADGAFSTTELSTGQRKRLALVTAYLEDRPVYVFDEWAADQDPRFKRVFYEELLPELRARGKAILAITHDDRYFHCADRVLRMDLGRVVREERPLKA